MVGCSKQARRGDFGKAFEAFEGAGAIIEAPTWNLKPETLKPLVYEPFRAVSNLTLNETCGQV